MNVVIITAAADLVYSVVFSDQSIQQTPKNELAPLMEAKHKCQSGPGTLEYRPFHLVAQGV